MLILARNYKDMQKILFTALLLSSFDSYSDKKTGVIHSLHVNLESNKVHVYLKGKPVFVEEHCSGYWTANSMDDEKFKSYFWPVLMTAHISGEPIKIQTNNCEDGYPRIRSIDFSPRE